MTRPLQRCASTVAEFVAATLLLGILLPHSAHAQQAVGVVTAVKGSAQLTRGTAQRPLEFRDDVVLQDIVATQERSLARILFGGSSTVTVRELSTLEVTEDVLPSGARRTVYDMSAGAILVRVINKLLGPGDEVQIKTPNAIAAVRGTTVFTRCAAQAAQALRCTFSLLAGRLTITPYGRPPLTLIQNTSVSITGDQASGVQVSPITTLTTAEAQQILAESDVRSPLETDGVESGIAARELQQATQLASTLVETVIPPIPTARELQNTSVPSDTEQTQAPVVAGGQGQAVDEAAGPSFPVTKFPFDIINEDLQLPPDTNLANVEGDFNDPFLLNIMDSSVMGSADAIVVGNANVNGVVESDPSTLTFTGNYLLVTGTTTAAGPLSTDVMGTFDIGESFLNVAATGELDSSAPAALQFDQSTVTTGNSLIFIDGTASVSGSLLAATNSDFGDINDETKNIDGDFLQLNGTLISDSTLPLFELDPTIVETTGDFVAVNSGGSADLGSGQLLRDTGGTYDIGESFIDLDGSLGSSTELPLVELNGSSITTGAHFIDISGGSLSTNGDILQFGPDSSVSPGGSLLNLDGGSVSGNTVLSLESPFTTPAAQPLFNVAGGTLDSSSLAVMGADLTLNNSFLSQSGGAVNVGTAENPADALAVGASTLTSTAAPVFDLSGGELNVSQHLVSLAGGTADLGGPLVATSGMPMLNIAGDLLHIASGASSSGPIFDISGGSVAATNLLFLAPGSTLDLTNSVLDQSGGAIDVVNVLNLQAPVTGPEAPLLDVSGGTLHATGALVVLGADLDLAGPLLMQTGGTVEADTAVNVDGGTLNSAGEDLFDLQGGNLTLNQSFLNVTSGNVATEGDLFTVEGVLPFALDGALLSQSGGTVEADNIINVLGAFASMSEAPLVNVSDGSLTANDSVLVLGEGAELDLQGPVVLQTGGIIAADNAVKVAGGSLTGNGLGFFELLGGTFTVENSLLNVTSGSAMTGGDLFAIDGALPFALDGSLLSQSGGTIEAGTILNVQAAFSPSTEAPLLQVGGGSLTANDSLLVLGAELNLTGPVLAQTGGDITVGNAVTVIDGGSLSDDAQSLFVLAGGSLTVNGSVLNVIGGTVATAGDLFTFDEPLPFTLGGSLLSQSGGTVTTNNLVNLQTNFTTAAGAPLINIEGGTLETAGSLGLMGAGLTLNDSFLSQSGGTIDVGTVEVPADAIAVQGSTLTSVAPGEGEIAAPVFDLSAGQLNVSRHLVSLGGGTANLSGPLLVTTGTADVNIAGDVLHIASTVNGPPAGAIFDVGGGSLSATNLLFLAPESTLDLSSAILTQTGGSIDVGNVLNLQAPVNGPEAELLFVNGGTLNATGALVVLGDELNLAGPILLQNGGDITVGSVIDVDGGSLNGAGDELFQLLGGTLTVDNSFLHVTSGSVFTEGDLFTIDGALPFTLNGSLLSQSGGTVEAGNIVNVQAAFAPPTGAPLLQVGGGSLTASDSLLVLGADLDLLGPVLAQNGGTITVGNAIAVAEGGNLTGGVEDFFALSGGTFTVNDSVFNVTGGSIATEGDLLGFTGSAALNLLGSLLNQSGGTVEVGSVLALSAPFTTPAGAPLIRVTDGSLSTDSLVTANADLTLQNSLLSQTGGEVFAGTDALAIFESTLTSSELPVFDLGGGNFTAAGDLVNISNGTLNLGGELLAASGTASADIGGNALTIASNVNGPADGSVFSVQGGTVLAAGDLVYLSLDSTLTLTGPLLTLSGGTLSVNNVFDLEESFTSPALTPLIEVSGELTMLNTAGSIALLTGAEENNPTLNLQHSLLVQNGGFVNVGSGEFPADALTIAANTVDSTATGEPVFRFDSGLFTGNGHLVSLAGGELHLGGPIAALSGEAETPPIVSLTGDGLNIASSVTGPPEAPLFLVEHGFLSADDLVELADGSTLTLTDRVLQVSGDGQVVAVGSVLNLGADLATPSGAPVIQIADDGSLIAGGSLADMSADLTLGNSLLAQTDGVVVVVEDPVKVHDRILTSGGAPIFSISGGQLAVSGLESAMVSVDGGVLDLSSPIAVVSNGAEVDLAGGFLRATNATIAHFDADEFTPDLLVVEGAGTNLETLQSSPLFAFDPTNDSAPTGVSAKSLLKVTGGANVHLQGPLFSDFTDAGSTFLLQDGVTITGLGSALTASGAGALFETGSSSFMVGKMEPPVIAGDFFRLADNATAAVSGPLLNVNGSLFSSFYVSGHFLRITDHSAFTSTGADPFIQLNESSFLIGADYGEGFVFGDFFQLSGNSTFSIAAPFLDGSESTFVVSRLLGIDTASTFISTALDPLIQLNATTLLFAEQDVVQVNSDESLSLAGSLLSDVGGTIDAGLSVLGINDGAVTATGSNPLLSFTNTNLETQEFDIVSLFGGSLSLEGPLVVADNSDLLLDDSILFMDEAAVNGTGTTPFIQIINDSMVENNELPLIDLGAGELNLASPLARFENSTVASQEEILNIEGTDVNGTSTNPFLQFINSIASSLAAFIGIDSSSDSVHLAGPLGRFEGSDITSDEELVRVVDSTVGGTGTDAFLQFDGTDVATQDTVFDVEGSNVSLAGPLVDAHDTTFAVADAPVPPDGPIVVETNELFLGVGPGASLSSTTTEPLITLSGGNAEVPALSANALAAVFDNSSVELAGPLATSDSNINVNAILGVGFNASLSSTTTEPLLQFSLGTITAYGAFTVVFGNASLDLAGPLATITDSPGSINAGRFLYVSEFSNLASTSADPLITVANATVNTEDFTLFDNDATVSLGGPFVAATSSTFVVGFADPSRFLAVQDGAQLFGPRRPVEGDAPALINLAGETTVTSALDQTGVSRFVDVRRTGIEENPSVLDLEGPLLTISDSEITTRADFIRVTQLAELTSTAETPLIQSENSTFNIGVDLVEADPAQDNFFRVDNFSGDDITGPAMVSLAGPLLDDVGSTFTVGQDFLRIAGESTLTSTSNDPLIRLNGSNISTADRLVLVFSDTATPSTLALAGPLLHATETTFQIDTNEDINAFAVVNGGSLWSTTAEPLIILDNGSQVTGSTFFYRVRGQGTTNIAGPLVHDSGGTIDTDRFLRVQEDSSLISTSPNALIHLDSSTIDTRNDFAQITDDVQENESTTRVEVSGTLIQAENSTLDVGTNTAAAGDFLQVNGGAQLEVKSSDPIVLFDGGTITVGTNDGTSDDSPNHLVRLQGRVLEEGIDQPVVGDGGEPIGSLVEARGGAEITVQRGEGDSSGGNAVRLDRALLQASLPIVNLIGGEEAMTTLTTANHAILANFSEIESVGPLVALDKSVINVTNGALLTLTNGSSVDVQGDLVKLINASRLNIINGPLVLARDGSTLDISDALVNFGSGIHAGNQVIINNAIQPSGVQSGIPFFADNTSQVNIGETPIKNLAGNSFTVNGAPIGGEQPLTGSVIQSLNNSTVNAGQQ